MAGAILASVPDNAEAGSYLTFAFPIILFCVIGAALYIVLFGRPHARVPARRIANVAHTGPPSPEAAQAAAVAAGLPLAEGGGFRRVRRRGGRRRVGRAGGDGSGRHGRLRGHGRPRGDGRFRGLGTSRG